MEYRGVCPSIYGFCSAGARALFWFLLPNVKHVSALLVFFFFFGLFSFCPGMLRYADLFAPSVKWRR